MTWNFDPAAGFPAPSGTAFAPELGAGRCATRPNRLSAGAKRRRCFSTRIPEAVLPEPGRKRASDQHAPHLPVSGAPSRRKPSTVDHRRPLRPHARRPPPRILRGAGRGHLRVPPAGPGRPRDSGTLEALRIPPKRGGAGISRAAFHAHGPPRERAKAPCGPSPSGRSEESFQVLPIPKESAGFAHAIIPCPSMMRGDDAKRKGQSFMKIDGIRSTLFGMARAALLAALGENLSLSSNERIVPISTSDVSPRSSIRKV